MGARRYMPDYIRDRCDLAHTYAEDGAYHSAARILTDLASEVAAHAQAVLPVSPTLQQKACEAQ